MNVWIKAAAVAAAVYYFTSRRTVSAETEEAADPLQLGMSLKVTFGKSVSADRGQDRSVTVALSLDNSSDDAIETNVGAIVSGVRVLLQPKTLYDSQVEQGGEGFTDRYLSIPMDDVLVSAGKTVTEKKTHNYYSAMFSDTGIGSGLGDWVVRVEYTLNGTDLVEDTVIKKEDIVTES